MNYQQQAIDNAYDAHTAIIFLAILSAIMIGIALIADRRTKRKHRRMASPRPDDRSSIEQFRRIHRP